MPDIDAIAAEISIAANALLDKYLNDIQENALNNPDVPFVIPQSEIDAVVESIRSANEQARQGAITEFADRRGDITSDQTNAIKEEFDNKIIFFLIKNISDGINRIHGTSIARQIFDDDRQAQIVVALDRSKAAITNASIAEIGASFALFHESVAVENGWRYFRYVTSEDEVVRSAHSSRNGKIFVYGKSRTVDDVPGLASHCRCFAFELTEQEAAQGDFFYDDDRAELSTAVTAKSKSLSYTDMRKFEIQAKSGEVIIDVVGFIDDWDGNDFRTFSLENDTDKLILNVTSRGGDSKDSLQAHDLLKSIPNHVTANIYGYAGSAATHFTSGADFVTIGEKDLFLIHNAWGCPCGTKEKLTEFIEELEEVDQKQIAIYKQKSGKTEKEIIELMLEDRPITAQEALEFGLVDEIREDSKRSQKAREDIGAVANFNALAQAQSIQSKVTTMKTVEQLEQDLAQAQTENNALTEKVSTLEGDLAVEKSKAQAAQAAAKSDDISDEARQKIKDEARVEILAETKALSDISTEIKAVGLTVEGDNVEEILVSAVQQAGGTTDGLDVNGLKAVFASIKTFRAKDGVEDEMEGVTSPQARTDNVTNIHDQINKKWGNG